MNPFFRPLLTLAPVSGRALFALLALFGSPVAAAAPEESSGATPTGPLTPAAIRAALGAASPDAQFDPSTAAEPGARASPNAGAGDTTYGPAANGLELYDSHVVASDPGYTVETPEFHVVQRGDTLWDISADYLVDPYLWPKLWSWNEHVTNAHWIFPGDRIRLSNPTQTREDRSRSTVAYQRTALPPGRAEGTYLLNQVAFVDASDFTTSMEVVGGSDAKVMMATLDTIYMSYDPANPPVPGERLVVYSPTREVADPETKQTVGYIVELMGEVQVDSVARQASEGTVRTAINPIERGYRVGPLRRVFRRIEATEPDRSAAGQVIATLTGTGPMNVKIRKSKRARPLETLAGDEQFVVVDLGSGDGVKAGNVLEVVRKGDAYTPKRVFNVPYEDGWPRRVVGALLVVDVQENLSLTVSVFSRREIEQGDHVEMRGPGLQR